MKILPFTSDIGTPLMIFPIIFGGTGIEAKEFIKGISVFLAPGAVKKVIFKTDYHATIGGEYPATAFRD